MKNGDKKKLYLIICGGLIFRLFLALGSDNFNHPDELFQALEQAHRLVFGYGFIPWEFQHDARSYLLPVIISIILFPFKLLSLDNPAIYIPALKIIFSIISTLGIFLAFDIGRKLASVSAGLWAALFYALWYDIAYFSIKPLSEVWAALFFLAAIRFALSKPDTRNIIATALFIVLTAAFRISYLPAAGLLGLYYLYSNRLTLRPFISALLLFTGIIAIFEWLTVGAPFISYYNLYQADKSFFLSGNIGATFGLDYLLFIAYSSLFLMWIFIISGFLDFKKSKLILLTILITLISHILLPVKGHEIDYRHIYIVIPLGFILGALLVDNISSQLTASGILTPAIILIFAVLSVAGATGNLPFQNKIYKGKILDAYSNTIFNSYDILKAYRFLYEDEALTGLYDKTNLWFKSGGYYYLHRDIPVYFYDKKPPSPGFVSHFLMVSDNRVLTGFEVIKKIGKIDIYRRLDAGYIYPTDSSYNRLIIQPGINLE